MLGNPVPIQILKFSIAMVSQDSSSMGTPGDYGMSSDIIAVKRRMYSVDSATTSGLSRLVVY